MPGRYLGIDEESITDAEGVPGIKITTVYQGTSAERAGLHSGDVIHSINGYQTVRRGNLAWIIANRAFGNVLTMTVRTAADGKVHVIQVGIPSEPVNAVRPPYLPPVGEGPPPGSR
jgi:S1-C subfamily serine protease